MIGSRGDDGVFESVIPFGMTPVEAELPAYDLPVLTWDGKTFFNVGVRYATTAQGEQWKTSNPDARECPITVKAWKRLPKLSRFGEKDV